MQSNSKRVHILLYETNEKDLEEINSHIQKSGLPGGLSEAIRYALRKTAVSIEGRSL